jgi:hypothetical protein
VRPARCAHREGVAADRKPLDPFAREDHAIVAGTAFEYGGGLYLAQLASPSDYCRLARTEFHGSVFAQLSLGRVRPVIAGMDWQDGELRGGSLGSDSPPPSERASLRRAATNALRNQLGLPPLGTE